MRWKDVFEILGDVARRRGLKSAALAAFDLATEKHLGGHLTLGPLTIYGNNAMRWAWNLRVDALGVTLCAKPPSTGEASDRGWYFYASPNGTPWAAVVACGPGIDFWDAKRIRERLEVLSVSPRPEIEVEKLTAKLYRSPEAIRVEA